jgi:hypothetical protein
MTEAIGIGKAAWRPKRFFVYGKVESPSSIGRCAARCRALVAAQGGVIAEEEFDVGAGAVVGMPGYARLYDALERGTVDAFATDMTVFGPTMILGLFAMCVVNGVEMWDLAGGQVTGEQIRALGEQLRHGLAKNLTVRDMLNPKNSVN